MYTGEALLNETFIERIANLLNNYLKQLILGDMSKCITYLKVKMGKYFNYNKTLRDMMIIYSELGRS